MTDPPTYRHSARANGAMLCAICARALIKYKRWHDWSGRATHYTCYKRANRELSMQMMLEDWRNAQPSLKEKQLYNGRVEDKKPRCL